MISKRSATTSTVAFVALAAAVTASLPTRAQTRYVVVNGNLLHPAQVARIEALFCSPQSPTAATGTTLEPACGGYEGNPLPQGQFVNRCGQAYGRAGFSQRGLLYSMSEILSGR